MAEVAELDALIPPKEIYIYHASVSLAGDEKLCTVLITSHSVIELVGETRVHRDMLEVHDVRKTPGGARVFFLDPIGVKGKVKVPGWGTGETASNYLHSVEYFSHDATVSFDLHAALKNVHVNVWQNYFENVASIVPAPDVYQYHLFVTKVGKKLQVRYLVLTLFSLHNVTAKAVKGKKVEVKKIEWSARIADVSSATIYSNDARAVTLDIFSEEKAIKGLHTFLVDSVEERDSLMVEVQRLYIKSTRKPLRVDVKEVML